MKWIIYGSYGYTGNLISEKLAQSGQDIIISGRNSVKLQKQGDRLGIPWIKADLNEPGEMDRLLKDARLVIHCAGPFIHTWKQMAEVCLRNKCHYLDITGEIEVFEGLKKMDTLFKDANIMALPGAGFDVVPSDCLAGYLKTQLPDAIILKIAFMGLGGGVSKGTAKTMIENLGEGGVVRRNSSLKRVPAAHSVEKIEFENGKPRTAVSIPWGDLSTAYTSTSIPNITVYMAVPASAVKWMKWSDKLSWILKTGIMQKLLKRFIEMKPAGPDQKTRESGRSIFVGTVRNEAGDTFSARQITPEGYKLTAETAILIANKISDSIWKPGYQTPFTAYGHDLILEIEGTERTDL